MGTESQPHRPRPQGPNTKLQWREVREPQRLRRPQLEVKDQDRPSRTWATQGQGPSGNQKSEARVGDPRPETQKGAKGSPPRVRDPTGSGPGARREQESEARVRDPRSEPKRKIGDQHPDSRTQRGLGPGPRVSQGPRREIGPQIEPDNAQLSLKGLRRSSGSVI